MNRFQNLMPFPQSEYIDQIALLYAPFREYVLSVVPLMLGHIWKQAKLTGNTIEEEIDNSAWVCRLITLDKRVMDNETRNKIDGWGQCMDYIVMSLESCKEELQLQYFIGQLMKGIKPVLDPRFKTGYVFPERQFHCWWYTIHDRDTHLAIHLINAYQPESPFKYLNHFVENMLQAIKHGISNYPNIEKVSCGSWLNQSNKFQQLWPVSFKNNQVILNETGGFGPGAWGQYMTLDGGFHEGKGEVLRQTGKHPFPLTESYSSVNEVINHIQSLLKNID